MRATEGGVREEREREGGRESGSTEVVLAAEGVRKREREEKRR